MPLKAILKFSELDISPSPRPPLKDLMSSPSVSMTASLARFAPLCFSKAEEISINRRIISPEGVTNRQTRMLHAVLLALSSTQYET
jgi:hypothetical protein